MHMSYIGHRLSRVYRNSLLLTLQKLARRAPGQKKYNSATIIDQPLGGVPDAESACGTPLPATGFKFQENKSSSHFQPIGRSVCKYIVEQAVDMYLYVGHPYVCTEGQQKQLKQ